VFKNKSTVQNGGTGVEFTDNRRAVSADLQNLFTIYSQIDTKIRSFYRKSFELYSFQF
jgi:hypothetical protein